MTGMPKRFLLSVPLLFLSLPIASALAESHSVEPAVASRELALKDADHQKVGKLIGACIEAYVERKGQRDAEMELRDAIGKKKWVKAAGKRDVLSLNEDLGAALYYAKNYSKVKGVKKGKIAGFEVPVGFYGEDFMAEYELWAPSKYKAKDGPYPLIICLPGGSNSPAELIEQRWSSSEVRDNAIIVSVKMPENEAHWAGLGVQNDPKNAGGIGILLSIFRHVHERYAIDFSRVYLVGEGAGGTDAAMRIANSFPDRFAAVACISGDAAEISPDNFANLPLYFAGGGSKATAFAKASKDAGLPEPTLAPEAKEADIWTWLKDNPRRSNPEELVLRAGSPFPNKAYWVEIPPSDGSTLTRLEAKADRASNTITIQSEGVRSVTIYFNDVIVDLDKPVKVILNGLENEDLIPRNFSSMMEQIYKTRSDPGKIYTAFKKYDIPEAAKKKEAAESQ